MLSLIRPLLGHLSLGLAALCLVLGALWQYERAHSAKVEKRAELYRSELKRISTTQNKQRETTTRTIERVRVVERDADKRASRVENAPVTGQCATPNAIMGADL
jgi:hypothetical protein